MKTLQIKVTGMQTKQTGQFEIVLDPDHPRNGKWRQRGGTLELIGPRGVVRSGSYYQSSQRPILIWGGEGGEAPFLTEFRHIDIEFYSRRMCGSAKGEGNIFMPSVPCNPPPGSLCGGPVKEPIEWEIELPPCGDV